MAVRLNDLIYDDGITADGYTIKSTSSLRYSTRVTNDIPTVHDIEAAFGFSSEVDPGFIGILNPSGAGTTLYVCTCDGTNWWYTQMILAT